MTTHPRRPGTVTGELEGAAYAREAAQVRTGTANEVSGIHAFMSKAQPHLQRAERTLRREAREYAGKAMWRAMKAMIILRAGGPIS